MEIKEMTDREIMLAIWNDVKEIKEQISRPNSISAEVVAKAITEDLQKIPIVKSK